MDGLMGRWMCGWMEEGINRMWFIHTVEYDSAMKRSEALTPATMGMILNTQFSAREADTEGRTVLVCLGCHSKIEGWGLQQQECISYSSGAQTSEIRASGWSGSGEALFLVGGGVFIVSSQGGRAEGAPSGSVS